jgi:MFS family permease
MNVQAQYGNLIAAIATIASCDVAMGFTLQLLPLLMEANNVPAWIIGLNTSMAPLGILLAGPILPRIIQHVGAKRVAYLAITFIILSLLLFKLIPSLYVWFPLRFLFGIASGALFTISEAWILVVANPQSRGRIMGLYTSVMAVSFAAGPLLLPHTGTDGWLPWVIAMSALGLSIIPLALVTVDDDVFRDEHGGSFWKVVARAPLLLFAVGAATLFDSVFIAFFTIFGMRSGLTMATASTILGLGIVGNMLFQYAVGMISDRWSRLGVVVISAILTIALSLSLIWLVHTPLLPLAVIVLGTSAFAVYVVALTVSGDAFRGADLIACSAAFSAMWGMGGLIGPSLAGASIDAFGINAMPVVLAVFYVILLIGLALNGGKLVKAARAEATV